MDTVGPYIQGSDLPDLAISWRDRDGTLHDFSSGWTFELKVGDPGSAAILTKTDGITGAATAPNLTIAWATSGELNNLTPGVHHCQLTATRTADSKHRRKSFQLKVEAQVT